MFTTQRYLRIREITHWVIIRKLLQIWPDIKKGESLTLITNEQGRSIFYHNDKKIGEINEPEFATDFLAIWLDKNTSEPELRKQLLGN